MLQNGTEVERIWFSIIIPVFNKKNYISKCLESVLLSSFKGVEIICIDDCSTDGSGELLEKYAREDSRVTIIENCENKGAAFSRNIGIEKANGKYIMFLDADDYIDPLALEKYYYELKASNAQGCFITIITDDDSTSIGGEYSGSYQGKKLLGTFVDNEESFLYACGAIWSLSFLKENNIYFRNLKIGEGGLFILNALLHAEKVVVSNYKGYHYMINDSSTGKQKDAMQLAAIGQLKQIIYMILNMQYESEDEEILRFLQWYIKRNMGGIINIRKEMINQYFSDENSNSKFLAEIVKGFFLENTVQISDKNIQILKDARRAYIYGAGYNSLEVIKLCNELNVEIIGVYVTSKKGNPDTIYGYKVKLLEEYQVIEWEIPFIVSAHKKHHDKIKETLIEAGAKKIILVGE